MELKLQTIVDSFEEISDKESSQLERIKQMKFTVEVNPDIEPIEDMTSQVCYINNGNNNNNNNI